MKSSKHLSILLCFLLILFIVLAFGFYNGLEDTTYTLYSQKVPLAFDNFRIVQISDLHSKNFGKNQSELIAHVKSLEPNLIVLTGDMIDDKHDSIKPVEDLIKGISSLAPIYAVSGNHDDDNVQQKEMLDCIYSKYNVTVLDHSSESLSIGNDSIWLTGSVNVWDTNTLTSADTSRFNILLFHYTNLFEMIAPKNYDLILSGHTHGGIIRLPFVGGIIASRNSLFPKYSSGMHTLGNSTMISSRGLGDTSIPRFNNRPEVVLIVLKHKKELE